MLTDIERRALDVAKFVRLRARRVGVCHCVCAHFFCSMQPCRIHVSEERSRRLFAL